MRVAVLANLKQNAPEPHREASDGWAELDSRHTVDTLVEVFRKAGHEAEFFEGDLRLVGELPRFAPDLCFNLCEGHYGDARESHVPALLEMMRLRFSGAGVRALAVTLDKPTTKHVLASHGLATPAFQVMDHDDAPLRPGLGFPLVVKPAHEGSGMGVTDDSLVRDEASLRREVGRLVERYAQPALVERYLPGREITVGMVGNLRGEPLSDGPWRELPARGGVRVLPLYEVLLDGGLYTDEVKNHWEGAWEHGRHYVCPAPMDDLLRRKIEDLAVATFRATGCRDVARVDLRIDEHGEPMVLEINALPGLSPGWSDLTLEAAAAGLSYDDLVLGIARSAVSRPL
jgi:D-alanine-D-alanine ligase